MLVSAGIAAAEPSFSWSHPRAISSHGFEGLACPTNKLCVAATSAGQVLTSTNPTVAQPAWRTTSIDSGTRLLGVSCTVSLCMALDATSILWSTTPTTVRSWHRVILNGDDPDAFTHIACPSRSLCVLSDDHGGVLSTQDPTGSAKAWSVAQVDPNSAENCIGGACSAVINGLACPSSKLCIAVDSAGDEIYSTDPNGGSRTWHHREIVGNGHVDDLSSLACPTASLCLATDPTSSSLLRTQRPLSGNWLASLNSNASTIVCPSIGLCIASNRSASNPKEVNLVNTAPTTNRWERDGFPDDAPLTGGACPDNKQCLLLDARGRMVVAHR
jgi:hypothetical protein